MKSTILIVFCFGVTMLSCNTEPVEKITGTYVREYSWHPRNINTEKIIGTEFFKDTIFITKKKDGYQIDNVKWKKKDYDNEGWQSQGHAQDRPMPTYTVSYDETDKSLNPTNALMGKIVYLDFEKKSISLNKKMENAWKKVE